MYKVCAYLSDIGLKGTPLYSMIVSNGVEGEGRRIIYYALHAPLPLHFGKFLHALNSDLRSCCASINAYNIYVTLVYINF